MSLFDSIIETTGEKFGLSRDKTEKLLSALLGLISAPQNGGFTGFFDRFRTADLGDKVSSWITSGDNKPISGEELESALGTENFNLAAKNAGVDQKTASSAMAFMVPQVVDKLTPDGEVPDEKSLLAILRGYSGSGAVHSKVSGSLGALGDTSDGDGDGGNSALRWLLPLILLILLVVLGYWFCGTKSTPTAVVNPANVNKTVPNTNVNSAPKTTLNAVASSFKLEAKDGKYYASGAVSDQATLDKIKAALTSQFGEGNVDFSSLKVNANAKPFAAGWWDNFAKLLPNLKDWKTGSISFAGNSIETAGGLSQTAIDQIKILFSGWILPVSIAGAETATKQANEEALKELGAADSVDEVVKALNLSIINFASSKSDIPADAKTILAKAAEVLKKQPAGTTVEIGGYTDNKGNADANKKLSQSRADAVKKELVGLGVSEAILKSVGYGDANPVGDNNTEDGRFKNRRIEYKTGSGSAPTAITTTTNTNSAANSAAKNSNK